MGPQYALSGGVSSFLAGVDNLTDSAVINFNLTNQPALFLQGTEDFNIPLAHGQRYEAELAGSNKEIYYLNGLNHHFTASAKASAAQEVPDTIYYWLQKIVSVPEISAGLNKQPWNIFYDVDAVYLSALENVDIVKIYTVHGQLVETLYPENRFVKLNKAAFPAGMYVVTGSDKNTAVKFVIFNK